jgi:hypothetical protein
MAVAFKFKCKEDRKDFLEVEHVDGNVLIDGWVNGEYFCFVFDISTAIKLSKTIRTEINKAKEEVNNG